MNESYGGVLWRESDVQAPGMKVVTDGDGGMRDGSCIMTSGFDPVNPDEPKQCNDDPMTSKRAKVYTDDLNGAIDLVFDVACEGVTDNAYRFFLKYENLSQERIKNFTLQLGTGIGNDFVKSTDSDGLSFADRAGDTLVSNETYRDSDLAAFFAFGLFGNASTNQNQETDGYYDPVNRAIFTMSVNDEDELKADPISDNIASLYNNTMQSWIPKVIAPFGYLYDLDRDPTTEAKTVADFDGSGQGWQNYRLCSDPIVQNLTGSNFLESNECRNSTSDPPVAVSNVTIQKWENSDLFELGQLEDFGNVNVNTHILVEEKFVMSVGKFTIRITPTEDVHPPDPEAPWSVPPGALPDEGAEIADFAGVLMKKPCCKILP